jgi:hypothetical protein
VGQFLCLRRHELWELGVNWKYLHLLRYLYNNRIYDCSIPISGSSIIEVKYQMSHIYCMAIARVLVGVVADQKSGGISRRMGILDWAKRVSRALGVRGGLSPRGDFWGLDALALLFCFFPRSRSLKSF